MEWRILNLPESVTHISSVFSTLGLDFFSSWASSGVTMPCGQIPCSLSLLLCAKSEELAKETGGEDIHLDLGSGLLSFLSKKALCRVASFDFPYWPNTIEISTTYPWHLVSCFYLLTFSITNKQKCWHVDSCHGLTVWFRSWRVSSMPSSHCVQLPLRAQLPSDLLLWWPTEALAQWWLAELHFPEWSDNCKIYWAQKYDPLHSA